MGAFMKQVRAVIEVEPRPTRIESDVISAGAIRALMVVLCSADIDYRSGYLTVLYPIRYTIILLRSHDNWANRKVNPPNRRVTQNL
jgi:hypothetical protein